MKMYASILISVIVHVWALEQGLGDLNGSVWARSDEFAPSGYSLEQEIKLPIKVNMVVICPDQDWYAYTKYGLSEGAKNILYFRSRRFQSLLSAVTFGSDQGDAIYFPDSIKFNEKGDRLFFGTRKGMIYMCKLDDWSLSWDCDTRINITSEGDGLLFINSIDVNKQNQIAFVWNPKDRFVVGIVQIKEQQLVLKDTYTSDKEKVFSTWIRQHPIDQQMLILIKQYQNQAAYVIMDLINITSKSTTNPINITEQNGTIQVSKDGRLVFVSTFKGVYPYLYSSSRLTSINSIYNKVYRDIKISADGKSLIGYIYPSTIELLQIQKNGTSQFSLRQNQKADTSQFSQVTFGEGSQMQRGDNLSQPKIQAQTNHFTSMTISLRLVTQIENAIFIDSSPDNNKIFAFQATTGNLTTVQVYTLCKSGAYLSDIGCLKCSDNCSNCHFDNKTCTSCPNLTFFLLNTVCYPCSSYIKSCSTCRSQGVCLSCLEFSYLQSNVCQACDAYGACKACVSDTNCTQCDWSKGYDETPLNGRCHCKQGFSFYSNRCIQCGVNGCLQCSQSNKCQKCDSSEGFNESQADGSCHCRQGLSFYNNRCIQCGVNGCLQCSQSNKCQTCDSSEGFNESSADGSCQCRSNYSQVNLACIQCSVIGCHKCEQTNECSQCVNLDDQLSENKQCIKRQNIDTNNGLYIYLGSGLGGVILVGIGVVLYCRCRRKNNKKDLLIGQRQQRQQEVREREQIRRDVNEEIIHREGRLDQPLIQEYIEKAKYSDEERIRLKSLFLNPSLNQK